MAMRKPNDPLAGLKRTIEEAVAIAERHGVEIPEDVEVFEAEPGELGGSLKGFFAGTRSQVEGDKRTERRQAASLLRRCFGRSDRSAQVIVTYFSRTGPGAVREYHGLLRSAGWEMDK
jgi:hypothetical protein